MSAKEGWNIISRSYQEKTRISVEDVHYGPISPGESELNLLGEVKDRDILELGCGGGQNAIALRKWGARSVGLDISEKQIEHARTLAKAEGEDVSFFVGNMEDLYAFHDKSFDVVLSSFAIGYAENVSKVFQEVFRILRNTGTFVFADTHPMANNGRVIRFRKKRIWGVSNYFNRRKRIWTWRVKEGVARFYGGQRTIQDLFDLLGAAGFVVERILEPAPYPLDRMSKSEKENIPYFEEGFLRSYDIWSKIPYTIIFKAKKP